MNLMSAFVPQCYVRRRRASVKDPRTVPRGMAIGERGPPPPQRARSLTEPDFCPPPPETHGQRRRRCVHVLVRQRHFTSDIRWGAATGLRPRRLSHPPPTKVLWLRRCQLRGCQLLRSNCSCRSCLRHPRSSRVLPRGMGRRRIPTGLSILLHGSRTSWPT